MRILVFYRPDSEFARGVEEFVRGLQEAQNIDTSHLQIINYDSRDGSATANLYDIMRQPAVLITNDDGSYVKHWEGDSLPLLEEVASYVYSFQ